MRRLLSCASLCACLLVALSIAMYKRGENATDWLRVSLHERSAVFAFSGRHVGAAVFTDPTGWTTRDGRRVKYQRFDASDLREQFPSNVAGFAYRGDGGSHLALAPMWFITLLGLTPPLVWLIMPKRKRASRPALPAAVSA